MHRVLHNLGGVKCQPFLKCSAYYVADLIPLTADSFPPESVTNTNNSHSADFAEPFFVFALFQAISIQKT